MDGALTPRPPQDLPRVWEERQRVAPGVRFGLFSMLIMRAEMPSGGRSGMGWPAVLGCLRPEWPGWRDGMIGTVCRAAVQRSGEGGASA